MSTSWVSSFQQTNKMIPSAPSLPLCHSFLTEITVLPLSFQKPVQGPRTNLTVTWAEGPDHGEVWDKYWALTDAAKGGGGEGEAEVGSTHLNAVFYLALESKEGDWLSPCEGWKLFMKEAETELDLTGI